MTRRMLPRSAIAPMVEGSLFGRVLTFGHLIGVNDGNCPRRRRAWWRQQCHARRQALWFTATMFMALWAVIEVTT